MGALTVTIPQLGFSVQGNKRVHRGTFVGSSSYAASGETYTNRNFGMNVVEALTVWPSANYLAEWNSGGTSVIMRRDRVSRTMVVDGGATASMALLSVGWGGMVTATGTVSIAQAIVRETPYFAHLQHTGSSAFDYSTQIATGDTTTINIHYTTASTGYGLYATTGGTLYTTNTVSNVTAYLALSDGSLIGVTADTTAGTRLISGDTPTTGQRIASTLTVDISVSAVATLSMGAVQEITAGTDVSGVTFRFEAVGV